MRRLGVDGLAHLSVGAIPVEGLEWGDETRGPGEAFLRAEMRIRRAVGAPRNRLLGALAREAAVTFGKALLFAAVCMVLASAGSLVAGAERLWGAGSGAPEHAGE
jgi:hypothetical protein